MQVSLALTHGVNQACASDLGEDSQKRFIIKSHLAIFLTDIEETCYWVWGGLIGQVRPGKKLNMQIGYFRIKAMSSILDS